MWIIAYHPNTCMDNNGANESVYLFDLHYKQFALKISFIGFNTEYGNVLIQIRSYRPI